MADGWLAAPHIFLDCREVDKHAFLFGQVA
jgi:hypothetical protein